MLDAAMLIAGAGFVVLSHRSLLVIINTIIIIITIISHYYSLQEHNPDLV